MNLDAQEIRWLAIGASIVVAAILTGLTVVVDALMHKPNRPSDESPEGRLR